MGKLYLYPAVSVSGASVLAVEILGTRIIGPYFGVSIFLWSALISVTLAALAFGYWLGGRWADSSPTCARFASLFMVSGLWLALAPIFLEAVIDGSMILGHRLALLASSALIFFPPLAVLGMVSPYALKLNARSTEVVGRAAGNLYAVSTVASVAAALATGFFLIPSFSVRVLTTAVGIILFVTGLVLALAGPGRAIRERT